jgi:hypothetical protein
MDTMETKKEVVAAAVVIQEKEWRELMNWEVRC